MLTARDIMTPSSRCTTAQPNDELERVVHALAYDGVGCVVVVDGGRPIGIVTKQDAVEWWLEKVPLECLVGAVANKAVVSASPWMSRDETASAMTRHRVHHVVVTDSGGFFVGIVSSWDVARDVGRAWELPFWEEFFDRVRRPRIREERGGRASAA